MSKVEWQKMSCRLGEQLSQTKHVWMCACLCVVMLVLHVHMHWAWEAQMISPLSCCADPSHWWKVVDRAEVSGVWVFVYSGEETEGRCIIFSASSKKRRTKVWLFETVLIVLSYESWNPPARVCPGLIWLPRFVPGYVDLLSKVKIWLFLPPK